MANTLMFEVGIKSAQEQLDKIKQEFTKANGELSKLMNLKVSIDGVDAVTRALSQIGDTSALRSLRNEIADLNREFSILSKGAGGSGNIADRGLAANIEKTTQSIERYTNKISELTEQRSRLVGGTRNTNYQNLTDDILNVTLRLEGARKKLAELNEQKNKPIADESLKKTTQDAQAFETALGRIETAISGLKSGMSVNLTGDFSKWAQEVQNVTASVRELVEQLQKMHTATATSAKEGLEPLLSQAQAIESLKNKYNELLKKKADSAGIMPTVGIDRELKDLEQKLPAAQAKFNESLEKGASVANSYAQAIQQLGQKYNHTGEQAQKLAEIIASGQLSTGNVQRGLKVGFNQATDIVNTIEALQKLKQEESKPAPQGGLFDPQKFTTLQEAIDKIIAEINRLKEAFAGVGEIRGLSQLTESMNALFHNVNTFKDVFATLSAAVNLTPTSEYVKKLQTDFEAAQAKVKELTEKLTALAAAQNNVAETASKAGKSEKQIGDSQDAMFNRYNKLLADIQNIKREIVEIQRGAGGGGPFGDKLGDYFSALNRIRNLVREITSSPSVADAITKGMSSEQLAKLNSALAALKTNFKEVIADAKDFNKATDKGSSQAEARIRKLGMAFNELKNYMKANGGSEEMRRLQSEIQVAIQKMRQLMNAGNFAVAINVYERLSGIIRQAATATKEFERSQQGVSSSVSHANANLQQQSQILTDLKSMAMQYLSVWGAQSFINNIIELGGQLEQQRLSIGAILQDTAQANYLFGQIKDLAIKSPFGVQQLDAMSKQLSAYGFQYSELYEWTKRLADISAATGTSVDRLALALGHVRAEGALSGYTLRQFSMGNIPLLQKLSENLGKTKQEIRKMTRAKEIGYEDVLNVLKQLTDEGGMFYEAQETMAQALNAKFKNLRDSFQIMYSEMAEGAPGDFLKGVATVLTDISKSWRVLMPIILSGAGALGVWKLATMALNHELERNGKLLVGNALATSKYSINQLRAIATTGRFTVAIRGLGRALMSIGKFIFNPVTLGFAAVEGLIYLWSKHNDEVRKAADLTKAYGEAAVESEKNISKQLEKIKPFSVGMDDSSLKAGIDSMIETVKNYAINGQGVINQMMIKDDEGKIMSLAEKYKYLRNELEETNKVYKELNKIKDAFEYGINTSDSGWFDDNVETNLTKYANAYKKFIDDVTTYNSKYGDSIEKAITNAEKSDSAFREATKNLTSYGEKLAVFWSNPDKYKNAFQYMNNLFGSGAGTGDALSLNESFFNYVKERDEAMNELDQFIENTEKKLKEKGYDFSKELAPEQVGALLKMSKDWLDKHPEWENIYDVIKGKLKGRWGIEIVPDVTEVEEELPKWLEDLQKELDKTGIKLTANMSMEQIVDEMKKAYDKAQTTINKLGPIAMQAQIDIKGLTDENIEKYRFLNPELYEILKEIKKAQDSQNQVNAVGQNRGLNFKGMKKDGSHKQEKEKKDQESAKAVREQVRVIKEAADAFQYWRDKVGDKGAWEHVQQEFGDVLAKIGVTADNIEDVRGQLKKIPQMKEYKAIKDKKVKTEIDKEIAKENDQFIRKDFERDTERFLSKTQLQLDNLTRSWETFNAVREATGNVRLAVELSGADYVNGETQNLADSIKKKIQRDFAQAGSVGIPFDINLSDREIKESIEKVMPAASEDQLKGLIEEYKKWRDLQRNLLNESITSYAKMLTDADSLQKKLIEINSNYKDQIVYLKTLRQNGNIDEDEYNNRSSQADRTRKLNLAEAFVGGFDWSLVSQIYGNILTEAAQQLKKELKKLISSEDFKQMNITEQRKYLDLQSKLSQNDGTVMSPFNISEWRNATEHLKNFQGATQRLIEATSDYEQAVRDEKEATKALTEAKTDEERATAQAALKAAKERQNAASGNMSQAQSDMQQEGQEFLDAESKAAQGLHNFASAIQTISSGKLSDFVMGIDAIIKTIAGKEKSASLGEAVTGILEGVGVKSGNIYGMIIAAIIELLDAIGDDAGGFVGGIIDKIFDLITGLIDDIFSGDLVEKIAKSIFEGIGSLISSIVKNIGTLPVGIFNIVKGAVGGIFGGLFEGLGLWNSDEDLQEEIEASQRQVKVLERIHDLLEKKLEYVLGGVYNFSNPENTRQFSAKTNGYREYFENQLKWAKKAQDGSRTAFNWYAAMPADMLKESVDYLTKAVEAFNRANKTGEYYDQQRALLFAQRRELETQLANEQDKKDSDSAAIENYRNQIEDLDFQIKNFAMDMAKALYDIDLQSWASELTDAVVSAWENGEDAAEAYTNKVKDLMKDLTKNILAKKVMEQAFKNAGLDDLIVRLMDESSGKLDYSAIPEIAKALGKAGANSTDVITRVLDEMERQGYIDKGGGESSSGSVTSGIKSITENTADLLASYINAIRADVSVNRVSISVNLPLIASAVQRSSVLAETQVALQTQIVQNTQRSAEAAEAIQNILRLATVDRSHALYMQ